MAKIFRCAELGVACKWETTAETEEEIIKKVEEHICEEHKMKEINDPICLKIRGFIRDVD